MSMMELDTNFWVPVPLLVNVLKLLHATVCFIYLIYVLFLSIALSAGSKEETFFDTQPWLESDCDDDFFSVKGGKNPLESFALFYRPPIMCASTVML